MAGPSTPALVALRRERDRTIEVLTEAFSRDTLDVDEFERRVDLAHQAATLPALQKLTADLQVAGADTAVAVRSEEETQALIAARPRRKHVVAIMGGAERKGQWRVPETLRVVALMGGVDLDFREALIPPGITHVHVVAVMGGVEIIVPPHLHVECDGTGIMGGFATMERVPAIPDPDEPLLRITGLAMMGGFEVSTRLPGESARQASKRRRREAKEKRQRALEAGKKQLR